jgi:hypothetical protein
MLKCVPPLLIIFLCVSIPFSFPHALLIFLSLSLFSQFSVNFEKIRKKMQQEKTRNRKTEEDEEEEKRRNEFLSSGRFSDLVLTITGMGDFRLHAFIVSVRCGYFWTCLKPNWIAHPQPQTLSLTLPLPLPSDGPWTLADLTLFWRLVYFTEKQWQREWHRLQQQEQQEEEEGKLQQWLRLHRLAQFFDFAPLVTSIEHYLLTTILHQWTIKTLALATTEKEEVLVPRLTMLLSACHNDVQGRWKLGCQLVLWALTIAPSLFPVPSVIHSEWATALQQSPFLTAEATNQLIGKADALVCTVCEHCFESTDLGHERVRLSNWSVIRPRHCYKERPWMLRPDTITPATHVAPRIEYLHIDLLRSHSSGQLLLDCDVKRNGELGSWYTVPSFSSAQQQQQQVPQWNWHGCCQRCKHVTAKLHIFALRSLELSSPFVRPPLPQQSNLVAL